MKDGHLTNVAAACPPTLREWLSALIHLVAGELSASIHMPQCLHQGPVLLHPLLARSYFSQPLAEEFVERRVSAVR
jgi:hypothetical protein